MRAERVHGLQRLSRRNLEQGAGCLAAGRGRAVQISIIVQDNAGQRKRAVGAAGKRGEPQKRIGPRFNS
jgi:hypothetical protein